MPSEYIIPEGMKLHEEFCSVTWWKIFGGNMPGYDCTPQFIPVNFTYTIPIQPTTPLTIDVMVGVLFVLCAGVLGSIIIELLYNKINWFVDPLFNRMVKRYNYTIERNRLLTMQGHP